MPLLSALAALALLVGGWGTEGFALFVLVIFVLINRAALVAMAAVVMTLNAERRAARADPLSPHVLNRGAGLERLEGWVHEGKPFYLSFIDLGGFKTINDRYGHLIGDEFVVPTQTELPTERLEALFRVPVTTSAGEVAVHADVGSVACPPGGDLEALLHQADTLMYRRKRVRQAA